MSKDLDKELNDEIQKIPQENLLKFYFDLKILIEYAQKDDYENFNITR